MRNVLIIDDEFLVRMGCKSIITTHCDGYQVTGEAKNSAEAMLLFEEDVPDVVICDIKIGAVNGLDLVEKMKKLHPEVKYIILTHYEDFDYVRRALRMGTDEYLLKSDLTPELMQKTLDKVFGEAASGETVPPGDEDNSTTEEEAVRACMALAMHDSGTGSRQLPVRNPFTRYWMAIFKMYADDVVQSRIRKRKLDDGIRKVLEETVQDRSLQMAVRIGTRHIYVLFCDRDEQNDQRDKKMLQYVRNCGKYLSSMLEIRSVAGISAGVSRTEYLPGLQEQAREALSRAYFEPDGIIRYEAGAGETPAVKRMPEPDRDLILNSIIQGRTEQLQEQIHSFFSRIAETGKTEYMKTGFVDLLSLFKEAKRSMHLESIAYDRLDYDAIESLCGAAEAERYILELAQDIMSSAGHSGRYYSAGIRKCIRYIEENYSGSITLGDLAEYVQKSKSYLSAQFRQETGMTVVSYIMNVRIEKAKELIAGNEDKMYEIARKTGFDNPYYFSKVFKEATGMTCLEYRNLHGGKTGLRTD